MFKTVLSNDKTVACTSKLQQFTASTAVHKDTNLKLCPVLLSTQIYLNKYQRCKPLPVNNIFLCLHSLHPFISSECDNSENQDQHAAKQPTGTAGLRRAKRTDFKKKQRQVNVPTKRPEKAYMVCAQSHTPDPELTSGPTTTNTSWFLICIWTKHDPFGDRETNPLHKPNNIHCGFLPLQFSYSVYFWSGLREDSQSQLSLDLLGRSIMKFDCTPLNHPDVDFIFCRGIQIINALGDLKCRSSPAATWGRDQRGEKRRACEDVT